MARPKFIIKVSDSVIDDLPDLAGLAVYSGLRDFVVATILKCKQLGVVRIDRQELVEALSSYRSVVPNMKKSKPLSSSNSVVSQRMKELTELGCVRVNREIIKVGDFTHQANVYYLRSISELKNHLLIEGSKSPVKAGRPKTTSLIMNTEFLQDKGISLLSPNGDVIPYAEGCFSILESCSRTKHDKRDLIKCEYYLGKDKQTDQNDFVKISASTSTEGDVGIIYSTDMRVVQALNGLLKHEYNSAQADMFSNEKPARVVEDYCFVDLYALTREIGLNSKSPASRQSTMKMLRRLHLTNFHVDATNSPYWRSNFMPGMDFNKADYRYITELYTAEEWVQMDGAAGKQEVPLDRYVIIKFHPLIAGAIQGKQMTFLSHSDLKVEKLDLPHRLNNWVKPVVGVREKGRTHQYRLDTFRDRVRPATLMHHFETQFYKLLYRQDCRENDKKHIECERFTFDENNMPTSDGVFWINGYYFRVDFNLDLSAEMYRRHYRKKPQANTKSYPVITVFRDVLDPIVGDESDHSQALRRQMSELEDDTVESIAS